MLKCILFHCIITQIYNYLSLILTKTSNIAKKALWVISGSHYQAEANWIYRQLEGFEIKWYKFKLAKFVYCCVNTKEPTLLSNYFTRTKQVSLRHTRHFLNNNKLYIPRYRANKMQACIKYQGF